MKSLTTTCIRTMINGIDLFTFIAPVETLSNISYIAVRGQDDEEGAVQRILNKKRIASIKDYVLSGKMFVNSFVINWVKTDTHPSYNDEQKSIQLPIIGAAAQLIDGQHRLAGIEAAMGEDPSIGNLNVIIIMAIDLKTKQAAEIFLNINSEQKPAPKSLIYDLYGITAEDRNYTITRANDIAHEFNENEDSPFREEIKYPGTPRGKGRLDLSTVVSTLRIYLESDGVLAQNNIRDLNLQKQIFINYFNALKQFAIDDNVWESKTQNALFQAAGFIGALEFFIESVLAKCVENKNFKLDFISSLFDYSKSNFISYPDFKSLDGKTARKVVKDNLKQAFSLNKPKETEYEV